MKPQQRGSTNRNTSIAPLGTADLYRPPGRIKTSVSFRPAVCHHDQDARDRCVQRGLLPVAVPSGQEAHGPGDQPGEPDQEGGKREVSSCVARRASSSRRLTGVTQREKPCCLCQCYRQKDFWVCVLMLCQRRPRTLTAAQTGVWEPRLPLIPLSPPRQGLPHWRQRVWSGRRWAGLCKSLRSKSCCCFRNDS